MRSTRNLVRAKKARSRFMQYACSEQALSYTIIAGARLKRVMMSSKAMRGPSWRVRMVKPMQMPCGQNMHSSPSVMPRIIRTNLLQSSGSRPGLSLSAAYNRGLRHTGSLRAGGTVSGVSRRVRSATPRSRPRRTHMGA